VFGQDNRNVLTLLTTTLSYYVDEWGNCTLTDYDVSEGVNGERHGNEQREDFFRRSETKHSTKVDLSLTHYCIASNLCDTTILILNSALEWRWKNVWIH